MRDNIVAVLIFAGFGLFVAALIATAPRCQAISPPGVTAGGMVGGCQR